MLLLALLACAPEPPPDPADAPETDLRPVHTEDWALPFGAALQQRPEGLYLQRGALREPLAIELVGVPAVAGARLAFSHRDDGEVVSTLELVELTPEGSTPEGATPKGYTRRALTQDGAPDRVALSPDGAWVAWVSGATGLASVWAAPFEDGEPQQLTNRGLHLQPRAPGEAPEGFVPPPHEGPLAFTEDGLSWTSPEGEHHLAMPPSATPSFGTAPR